MRDRWIIRLFTALFTLCIVNTNAYCLYIDSSMTFYDVSLSENLIVTDTGKFKQTRTDIDSSISILNRGVINSDFYITGSNLVYVTNSGKINGVFNVVPDAKLVQIIQSNDDITNLSVNRNFSVLVRDANDISVTDVFNIATNADKLTFDNSTLVLNSPVHSVKTDNGPGVIEIIGNVVIKLNSANSIDYSSPIFRKVSEVGHVYFDVLDIGPLYNAVSYFDDGDLYMKIIRETDYGRIFENGLGTFLNNLRRDMPDDKLLVAMDNAPDMDTLNSIMHDSVRLHPINLMRPVRRMHILDALDRWRYSDVSDIDGATDVMFSDDMLIGRVGISMTGNVASNLYAASGVYLGKLIVTDDINDFTGNLYGANLNMHFDDGVIIGNLSGGIVWANFDVGPVFDGDATVFNPSGISGFIAMDAGTYLYREYDFTIVPFAGVITNYASVLNDSDTIALANFGLELNLSEYDFDILYDYGIRGGILTDGAYHVGAFAKFTAPDDDIGAQINATIIHDEFGFSYKASVSINMAF